MTKKMMMSLVALAACTSADDQSTATFTATFAPLSPAQVRLDRVELASDGVPYFARGALGRASKRIASLADVGALDGALPQIAATFRVPVSDLVASRVMHDDDLGMTHVRYVQRANGLRVVGGELVVHLDALGNVRSVNSTARDASGLASTPALAAAEAARRAVAATEDGRADVQGAPELVYVIRTRDERVHLAWEVTVTGREALLRDRVYVDALGGEIVARRAQIHTARNRTVHDGHDGTYPFVTNTTQVGAEAMPPTGDAIAVAAFENTGASYDCLQALFTRDSYDNTGAELRSLIHVSFFTGNGSTPNNAAWTGSEMVYGDGDGQFFAPLALAYDVTTHELVHGVTTSTANLAYENESGALNEGMSDIFAAVCEAWKDNAVSAETWLIGEDVFTPSTAGDALRYMMNPTLDWDLYPPEIGGSRDYYPERYMGSADAGGVHLNSGIVNLAFGLSAVGGTHPRQKTNIAVPAVGMRQAGEIYYRALTMGYFTENTNMAQARTQLEEVAAMLHPGSEVGIGRSWAAVGVGAMPPADAVPPTVAIASPSDGATVDAGFSVEVNATDDVVVTKVELAVDGAAAGTDTEAPYTFATDAALAPGTHTITATAFDGTNMATASISVTIEDPDAPMNPMNPDTGEDEGGGCCSANGRGEPLGAGMLLGLTAFALRRRRRG